MSSEQADLPPVEWLDRVIALIATEVAGAREHPPRLDMSGDENEEPRVLRLLIRRANAATIRDNLDRLGRDFPRAFGDAARWFHDEMAEAEEHPDPESPTLLTLYVKTRQVERFLADLRVKVEGLRKASLPA
jgi:hypothetical protein